MYLWILTWVLVLNVFSRLWCTHLVEVELDGAALVRVELLKDP